MADKYQSDPRPGLTGLALAWLAAWLLVLAAPAPARAEAPLSTQAGQAVAALDEHWFLAPQVKRLFRSHTSFQFGDPSQRQLNPLSRLEFPLGSWWGGLNLGLEGPRFRLELGLLTAIPDQDDIGVMRDSDWEDTKRPKVTTTYSESTVKLKNSLDFKAKLSMSLREHLPTPSWLDVRPLLGVRWQKFVFVTHDGIQQNQIDDPASPEFGTGWSYMSLPGDIIWFRQEYLHAYIGLMLNADLSGGGLGQLGRGWQASLQGDLAQVWGENRDRHLLRQGNRVTTERTQGYAWHTALTLKAPLWSWGSLLLSGDYLYIYTNGDHTMSLDGQPDETWDYGVKVWSQQAGLSLSLEVPF